MRVAGFRLQVAGCRAFVAMVLVAGLATGAGAAVKFDLGAKDAKIAALKATIADPKAKPGAVINAKYELLRWDMLLCEDADFPARRKAMLDFLSKVPDGIPVQEYVTFLYRTVGYEKRGWGMPKPFAYPDVDELADRATRTADRAARLHYYTSRIASMAFRANNKDLDPKTSREARLELIAAAEKDPLMKGTDPVVFAGWRFAALRDLGRDADAVALAEGFISASTNVVAKKTMLTNLAEFHILRAKRYCDESEPSVIRKAEACYEQILELSPDPKRNRQDRLRAFGGLARCRFERKDYDGQRAATAEYLKIEAKGKSVIELHELAGDAAYAEGKWQLAVDEYLAAGGLQMRDLPRKLRLAGAYHALGRDAEAVPILEFACEKGNKFSKARYRNALRKLKDGASNNAK